MLSPKSLRRLAQAAAVVAGGLTAVFAPPPPYGLTGTAPSAQPPATAPATPATPDAGATAATAATAAPPSSPPSSPPSPASPPSSPPSPPPAPPYDPAAEAAETSSFIAYEEKDYAGKSVDIRGCGPHEVPLHGSYRWIHRGQSGEMHNAPDGRDPVHTTLDSYRDAEQDTPFGWQRVNIVC